LEISEILLKHSQEYTPGLMTGRLHIGHVSGIH